MVAIAPIIKTLSKSSFKFSLIKADILLLSESKSGVSVLINTLSSFVEKK